MTIQRKKEYDVRVFLQFVFVLVDSIHRNFRRMFLLAFRRQHLIYSNCDSAFSISHERMRLSCKHFQFRFYWSAYQFSGGQTCMLWIACCNRIHIVWDMFAFIRTRKSEQSLACQRLIALNHTLWSRATVEGMDTYLFRVLAFRYVIQSSVSSILFNCKFI